MIRLTLPLCCPLNSLYRALPMRIKGKGGGKDRTIAHSVLSRRARIKRDEIVAAIHKQLHGRPEALRGSVSVQVMVYPRNAQSADADAYLKQLLDCLQRANVVSDDKQVVRIACERAPQPQSPGRMELEIWEIPE